MATIDLTTTPSTAPGGLLETLPRRVTLTLPELRLVAEHAGGAPLPFDLARADGHDTAAARPGAERAAEEDRAYLAALDSLHDPRTTLERRGLLTDDGVDQGAAGAVGLLATPRTAVDIDVTAAGIRARAWHRQAGDAVATLSTVDGIVFELAWFPTVQWAGELGRVAVLPEEVELHHSAVPGYVEIPFGLADAAAEAMRNGRGDLLPVLSAQHEGTVDEAEGPLADVAVGSVLTALSSETRGRLQVLVADVSGDETTVVGVVSWTLLADGWHSLRPRTRDGRQRVVVRSVTADDLAPQLAPVLAEVTR